MTTREINATYDQFIFTITSNGVVKEHRPSFFTKFQEVKKVAIDMLTITLERHHGRGDHSLTIYGTKLIDTETPERRKVGFPAKLELVKDQELFTL